MTPILAALIAAVLIVIMIGMVPLMWWMYFRLVPRMSAWILKKMGIEE